MTIAETLGAITFLRTMEVDATVIDACDVVGVGTIYLAATLPPQLMVLF